MSDHDDESAPRPGLDRALLLRLLGILRPHRALLFGGGALLVAGRACDWVGPWLIERAIDGPLRGSVDRARALATGFDRSAASALGWLAAGYLGVALAGAAVRYLQAVVLTRLGQATTFDVRRSLFRQLLALPLAWLDRKPVGELVTRMTSDIENLVELFSTGAAALLLDPLWIVVVLATLFALDVRLALVAVASLPIFALASYRFREKARNAYRETRRAIARNASFFQESIAGVKVTQLTVQQERMQARAEAGTQELLNAWQLTIHHFALFFAGVDWLALLVRAAVFVYGAKLVSEVDSGLTPGTLIRVWICLGFLFEPLRELAERWNVLQSALVSTERLSKILEEPSEPSGDRPHLHRGSITFDHVDFAYTTGPQVLHDVTFNVEPGHTVAFVGATGAGKSTLMSLLLRLYQPTAGTIRIDQIPSDLLALRALRSGIGVVPQDVFLFADTVFENVRLFDPAIDEAAVRRACTAIGADGFIGKLPNGYQTPLGERGQNLAAGERQLLAFARVLVRDPQILILDEATSSVDTQTERQLQSAIETLLAGRTALVIAHRLSTIRKADQIVVLHHGRVRESGTHAELLALRGIYSRLHQLHYSV